MTTSTSGACGRRIAVYSGTFDPITLGHEDVIRRAAGLFDELIVAVAVAHHKKTLFTLEQRLAMVAQAFAGQPQVRVLPFGLEQMPPPPPGKQPWLFFSNRGLEPIYRPQAVIELFAAEIYFLTQLPARVEVREVVDNAPRLPPRQQG